MRRFTTLTISLLLAGSLLAADGMQSISQSEFDDTLKQARSAYMDKDYGTAFKRYAQTAQWGDKKSQYIVGQFYLRGMGVEKNPVEAYAWLATAAEAPITEYRNSAKKVLKRLSDNDQDRAREKALALQDRFGMDATGVACKRAGRTGTNFKQVECGHMRKTVGGKILVPQIDDMAIAY